jgi:two-component system OmpR family response regulator
MIDKSKSAVVVEDDPDIRALIAELLRQSGFEVAEASNGADGLAMVRETDPDVVTLDLNLPDLDGIEVCRRLREITDAYVVMLTARPDEIDRLMGLEIGADDYLTKPFSPRELRARIAAMLRRPRQGGRQRDQQGDLVVAQKGVRSGGVPDVEPPVVRLGGLEVDIEGRIALLDGLELELTRTEFDLLATLLSAPRRVWARDTLLRTVWGSDWISDGHLVEVHMGNLRRKLGDDPRSGRYIRTVRGVGYRLGSG